MNQNALTLNHYQLLDPLLKAIQIPLSEYCFSNLYFFKETHQYEVLSYGDNLFIMGQSYDNYRYLMPLKNLATHKAYAREMIPIAQDNGCHMLFPIAEEWLEVFTDLGLSHTFKEGDSDYLYASEKMQAYPGRKLHKKRNLQKQYEALYTPRVEELSLENRDGPLFLLDLWLDNSGMDQADYLPCKLALEHFKELGLTGAVFYADDRPAGFILGEAVSLKVFTVHFAKADIRYKGVYQFMFNRFARQFCKDYGQINLEQDMGIEGLRKNKRSYRPDTMAKKYRVFC